MYSHFSARAYVRVIETEQIERQPPRVHSPGALLCPLCRPSWRLSLRGGVGFPPIVPGAVGFSFRSSVPPEGEHRRRYQTEGVA